MARNPSLLTLLSDSNMTNKEFPVLEILKLPRFPLSIASWVDCSFDPSWIVTESDSKEYCPTYKKNSKSVSVCESKSEFLDNHNVLYHSYIPFGKSCLGIYNTWESTNIGYLIFFRFYNIQ